MLERFDTNAGVDMRTLCSQDQLEPTISPCQEHVRLHVHVSKDSHRVRTENDEMKHATTTPEFSKKTKTRRTCALIEQRKKTTKARKNDENTHWTCVHCHTCTDSVILFRHCNNRSVAVDASAAGRGNCARSNSQREWTRLPSTRRPQLCACWSSLHTSRPWRCTCR